MKKSILPTIILVLCLVFVVAAPLITQVFPTTSPYSTSNNSVNLEWNITEANLKSIIYNWNETNTTVYDDSVILMMNFDNISSLGESDSLVYDISGNGNNGSVINAIWNSTAGKYNGAFEFDGSGDLIDCGGSTELTSNKSEISIFLWIKSVEADNNNLFAQGYFNRMTANFANGKITIVNKFGGIEAGVNSADGVVPNLNEWYHVGYTYNASAGSNNFKIYVNGEVVTQATRTGDITDLNNDFRIAASFAGPLFNGTLDNLIYLNKTLSQEEITNMYNSNLRKYENNKWNYYINQSGITSNVTGIQTSYYLCSSDISNSENCTEEKIIVGVPELEYVYANFTNENGMINNNFYGANTHGYYLSNLSVLDANNDGVFDTYANDTWYKEKWLSSKLNINRIELALEWIANEDGTFENTSVITSQTNINAKKDAVKFAYDNDQGVIVLMAYMPNWLANVSSGYCSSNRSCSPNNYTRWGELNVDALNYITNNGEWISAIDSVEIWNEPDLGFWLNDLSGSDPIKSIEYNKLFNASFIAIRNAYPSVKIIGPTVSNPESAAGEPILNGFIGNFTNEINNGNVFLSFHEYLDSSEDAANKFVDVYNNIISKCDSYGANCSFMYLDEYNYFNQEVLNDTSQNKTLGYKISSIIAGIINNGIASKISMSLYEFSSSYKFGIHTPENTRWHSLSGPQLDNEIYITYTILKNLATYHSAGSITYISSSSADNITTVTTKKGGQYALTIINEGEDAKNISANLTGNYPYDLIINAETGEEYNIIDGIINIGILDSQDIVYLIDGIYSTIIAENNIYTNNNDVNITATIIDENGIDNATIFIYDENGALINTTTVAYSNETSADFSWFGNLFNGAYTWVVKVWNNIIIETVSSVYSFFVNSDLPEIEYISPTPENGTHIYQNNFLINYSTNDTYNKYSFIELDKTLVAWYRFEGNIDDDSSYENPATFRGTQTIVKNSTFGEAYNFNGIDNKISIPHSFDLDVEEDITLSAWVNLDSFDSYKRIVTKSLTTNVAPYTVYGLMLDDSSTNKVRMELTNWPGYAQKVLISSSNISVNSWYHIVGTYDYSNDTARIYINGVLDNISYNFLGGSKIVAYPFSGLTIGDSTYEGTALNGSIDEVMVFSALKTDNEVLSLYNSTNTYNNFTNLSYDNHTIQAFVVNQAGSKNEAELRTFDLGKIPPEVNASAPVETFDLEKEGDNLTLIYNISRTTDDIDSCYYLYKYGEESPIIQATTGADSFYGWVYMESLTQSIEINHTFYSGFNPTFKIDNDKNSKDFTDSQTITFNESIPSSSSSYELTVNNIGWHYIEYSYENDGFGSGWFNNIEGLINETLINCSGSEHNFTYASDENTITIFSNDTTGLLGSDLTTWNYKVLELSQTYNEEVTEGSSETFLATVKLGSGISITDEIILNYGGVSTVGQAFIIGDSVTLRAADFIIPNINNDTNITFYWDLTLSDLTRVNLTSKIQTVYKLDLDNCSVYTKEILNFTVVDEETQIILPGVTIEIAVNLLDSQRTQEVLNYSNIYTGINPLSVCISRNISNTASYSLDTIVRYEDSGSANEYYNIVNSIITGNSSVQKITLYDLNLSDSTEFQLTFTGSDFLPVENALVYVDRQYISENTFKTVELPKTDFNGQAVLHLVRNDVIYNIRIIKDGVVLGNFENLVAFCDDFTIGDCNIELNAFDSVQDVFNYDEAIGIIFTEPSYNANTSNILFNFVTSDGTAKTVELEVTRNDIFGNRSICSSSLISSGGTLSCEVDPNIDDSTLRIEVYVDGVSSVVDKVDIDSTNWGAPGYLIMFVMAISFVFMFSGSKTGILISLGVTLAGALGLGLISGNLIGIGASGMWLIIIIVIGIYKLNRERAD